MSVVTVRSGKRLAGACLTMVAMTPVLSACSGDEDSDPAAVSSMRAELNRLESRIAVLETGATPAATTGSTDLAAVGFAEDPAALIGQQVTLVAEVIDLRPTISISNRLFTIEGENGRSIIVLTMNPPPGLDINDVVRVVGSVVEVQERSFEKDFGHPIGEYADNSDNFFADNGGKPAVDATSVEVVDEN